VRKTIGLIPFFVIVVTSCAPKSNLETAFATYMREAVDAWRFQGSILVAKNDTVLFEGGFGLADKETGRKNKPSTQFPIASITKVFTAIAVMQLIEQGKLELDQPVTRYLRDYLPETGDRITIRHLLSHTSGMPDFGQISDFPKKAGLARSLEQMLEIISSEPLLFDPGSRQHYSSSGYFVLGAIVEEVAQKSYETYIRDHVARPFGLQHTGFVPGPVGDGERAFEYFRGPDGGLEPAVAITPTIAYSVGALLSTVGDLHRLDRALAEDTILEAPSIEMMTTPAHGEYGLGFAVRIWDGHRIVGHGGGAPGVSAVFERWPDEPLCVVVLSNVGGVLPQMIADGLAAVALGREPPAPANKVSKPVDREALAEYEGAYKFEDGNLSAVSLVGDQLTERAPSGFPMPLLMESEDLAYFQLNWMSTIHFSRDDAGRVSGYTARRSSFERSASRILGEEADFAFCGQPVVEVGTSILENYVGNYEMPPHWGVWSIEVEGGDIQVRSGELPPLTLLPLSDSEFCIPATGERVVFESDGDGNVVGLAHVGGPGRTSGALPR
jgi:CubicO group peptidase (beta-lactamase class C family)